MAIRKPLEYPGSIEAPESPFDACRVSVGGRRCCFPATIYDGHGRQWGHGECRLHYHAPVDVLIDVIEASEAWKDARQLGHRVPTEYRRHDGKMVPGYPSAKQERADRGEVPAMTETAKRAAQRWVSEPEFAE